MSEQKKYKVAVCGSRSITNPKPVYDYLDAHFEKIEWLISGGAIGVDSNVAQYSRERGVPLLQFFPKYKDKNGNKIPNSNGAPLKRNWEIVKAADIVIVFHDGESTGSLHVIESAKKLNKKLKVIEVK